MVGYMTLNHVILVRIQAPQPWLGTLTKNNVRMHFIYILRCSDESLYVGCTNDLRKRIKEHNESKKGAHYTKIRRPVVLEYAEKFKTLREARRREAEIKRWRRKKKLELIRR